MRVHDVLVAGGGPAGASAAFRLARRGYDVAIVDRAAPESAPAGETVPPPMQRELACLGLPTSLLSDAGVPSYGIEARWGTRHSFHSHIADADGNAWHLDRRRFARAMLEAASMEGAVMHGVSAVVGVERRQDSWAVRLRADGRELTAKTRYLVDATGRPASLARMLGARRGKVDSLCGVACVLSRPPMSQTLCVESTPEGWWYIAPLGEDRAVACLMSDADQIRLLGANRPATWWQLFQSARLSARIEPIGEVQVFPCETASLDQVVGTNWIAIGDAACTLDPLASAGVLKAVASGRTAADAIHVYLSSGDTRALDDYRLRVTREFATFLAGRRAQYRLESRWTRNPFWRRRVN